MAVLRKCYYICIINLNKTKTPHVKRQREKMKTNIKPEAAQSLAANLQQAIKLNSEWQQPVFCYSDRINAPKIAVWNKFKSIDKQLIQVLWVWTADDKNPTGLLEIDEYSLFN